MTLTPATKNGRPVAVRGFAKINLSLRVLGSRPDGYHELRTVFQSIALHDTLIVRAERGPFRFECDDPACPVGADNLVWRAAHALWTASGRRGGPRDVVVRLRKRIPMQAGLGGGSSDAAAALVALAGVWRGAGAKVTAVAPSLGADVPYFLQGGTVLGLERGDLLFPLMDAPARWVVLALPPFSVSTKEAFGWWDDAHQDAGEASKPEPRRRGRRMREYPWLPENDFESLVAARHPEITRLLGVLRRGNAEAVGLSGTGSAVFGLFERRTEAERAVTAVRGRLGRALLTRTVNRARYQRLAGPKPIV